MLNLARYIHSPDHSTKGTTSHPVSYTHLDVYKRQLLSGELRLALRRHFTNKDIARVHLSAYTYHTEFIEILQCILADVRNIAGDLLRPKLRIARFRFILLNICLLYTSRCV